jgi:hypothetical protein
MVTASSENISVEEKPSVYVLNYQSNHGQGSPRLVNASLTLRRPDLHAIEQTLRVEEDGEVRDYRFIETVFERRPIDSIQAAVFDIDATLAPRTIRLNPVAASAGVTQLALQLQLLERLDSMNALLADQFQVKRDEDGVLVVEGTVATPERKSEILKAIGSLARAPGLRLAITTVAEAESQQSGPVRLQVQSVEVNAEPEPGNSELRRYFAAKTDLTPGQVDDQILRFSNNALQHIAQAQLHALALRQLTEAFSADELRAGPAEARQQWSGLVRRHAAAAQREFAVLREELAPVFDVPASGQPHIQPHDIEVRSAAAHLAELSARIERVMWKALATSAGETSTAQLKGSLFWDWLKGAEQLASQLAIAPLQH